jgi:hypothetical protein
MIPPTPLAVTAQQNKEKSYIAVSLWLSNGGTFVAVLEHQEAERLFSLFQEGTLPNTIGEHNFKCAPGPSWRVKSPQIISLQVLTPDAVKAIQQQQLQGQSQGSQGGIRRNASGLPY